MNVLSVFDGLSAGQIALQRAGIKYDNYYASEIDKNCIKVTQANYPLTIQLGDALNWKDWNLPKIDLILLAPPCQSFSFSGKGIGFEDPRGSLFLTAIEILNHYQPKYFLAENVVMKKDYEEVISNLLDVKPILLNSSLLSAQNRSRLYWANFKIQQPLDSGIELIDILEDDEMIAPSAIRGRYLNKATILGRRLNSKGKREDYNKEIPISQCLEVRATNRNKSNCLTTVEKDNVLTTMPIGRHPDAFKNKLPFRYYTLKEYCRLQTIPENYFDGIVSESQAKKQIGNSWTVDIIAWILSQIKYNEN